MRIASRRPGAAGQAVGQAIALGDERALRREVGEQRGIDGAQRVRWAVTRVRRGRRLRTDFAGERAPQHGYA